MTNLAEQRLAHLLAALDQPPGLAIVPHVNPDPDAIAAAVGLQALFMHLGYRTRLLYAGRVGRAENRALIDYLERPFQPLLVVPLWPIVLVDTQPGAGNSPFESDTPIAITFDHHPLRDDSTRTRFADIRPTFGATSTIVYEYMQAAGYTPDSRLATVLYYGIKTDTMSLERGATAADVAAYEALRALIDRSALRRIQQVRVPAAYFRHTYTALQAARVYDAVLVAHLGQTPYPDLAAEMADWLLRYEGVEWVLCTGVYRDVLNLALRTVDPEGQAGRTIQTVLEGRGSGGGHGALAGAQIPLTGEDPAELAQLLQCNLLRELGQTMTNDGRALLDLAE